MKVRNDSAELNEEYKDTVAYYDGIAEGYDELHYEEQEKKFRIIKEYLNIPADSRVLDVGCGTFFSFDYFNWDMFGIEPSEKMVSLFIKNHPSEKNRIRVGFAEEILNVYGRDKFDALICVSVVHHFKDIFAVFEQMKIVCKNSAVFAITVLKGVHDFRGFAGAIGESFNVENVLESPKDLIFICRKK